MNLGFRYHLASLMAVFLSLFLGILIGAALFQDSGLVEEQGLLITEMEHRFQELETSLASAQQKLELSAQAGQALREFVIQDRLAGHIIYLVRDERLPKQNSLIKTLEFSGAKVQSVAANKIPELNNAEKTAALLPLSGDPLDDALLADLHQLAASNVLLAFTWPSGIRPDLTGLPPALYIDSADTLLGEISLVLGLAAQITGHYGLQEGAKGLFP